jgi:hypothetical protein
VIVTAMLAWYDEDPDMLYRAVKSAGVIADQIVAADGRWDFYPGEDANSPEEQHEAIRRAASSRGMRCFIRKTGPGYVWKGQVDKRNHLLDMASSSDWVLPLDADWEIKGQRNSIRHQLEQATADAMVVPFYTPPAQEGANLDDVASTDWHKRLEDQTVYEPLVMRYLPEIRIDDYHWLYSGLNANGDRVALWGWHHPQSTRQDLKDIVINHWCLHRDQRTVLANRAYCDQRDKYAAHYGREP